MRIRVLPALILAAAALATAGCSAEPYDKRMQFLDEVSAKGVTYRDQLHQQGTAPNAQTCKMGYNLLRPDIPYDRGGGTVTIEWQAQVQEAYIKSCMTGAVRPKPDVSGTSAVTPVPVDRNRKPAPSPAAAG